MSKTDDQADRFASICPAVQTERGTVDEAAFEAAISLLWGMENECDDIDERCDALETSLVNRCTYLVDKAWRRVDEAGELTDDGEEVMAQARKIYQLMERAGMVGYADLAQMITD